MKRNFRMTEEILNQMRVMLLQGRVGCDIAYEFGCSLATVSKVRKSLQAEGWERLWHNNQGGVISASIGS